MSPTTSLHGETVDVRFGSLAASFHLISIVAASGGKAAAQDLSLPFIGPA